ncbi:hypothetical protein DRI50_11660 [candidate division KSB1 bacterium]|jgi:hypothetical protein|nr:MAG: hypothetical protein DRI50_11660 [candidate division KSB1 bacterium]
MNRLAELIKKWPRGAVLPLSYLKEYGITREHIKQYKKSGWIENIGYGAYCLKGDKIEWPGAVFGLQRQRTVHIGGKSALELKGFGHYLASDIKTLYLFDTCKKPLPRWFLSKKWGIKIHFTNLNLFTQNIEASITQIFLNGLLLNIAAPERAILEMLYFVPQKQSFEEAMKIMEALTTLRPELLQSLLENCRSIKAKRLFLFMAEKHNHFWFSYLNKEKINLGEGKRRIVDKGILDKKYLITVPQEHAF